MVLSLRFKAFRLESWSCAQRPTWSRGVPSPRLTLQTAAKVFDGDGSVQPQQFVAIPDTCLFIVTCFVVPEKHASMLFHLSRFLPSSCSRLSLIHTRILRLLLMRSFEHFSLMFFLPSSPSSPRSHIILLYLFCLPPIQHRILLLASFALLPFISSFLIFIIILTILTLGLGK